MTYSQYIVIKELPQAPLNTLFTLGEGDLYRSGELPYEFTSDFLNTNTEYFEPFPKLISTQINELYQSRLGLGNSVETDTLLYLFKLSQRLDNVENILGITGATA